MRQAERPDDGRLDEAYELARASEELSQRRWQTDRAMVPPWHPEAASISSLALAEASADAAKAELLGRFAWERRLRSSLAGCEPAAGRRPPQPTPSAPHAITSQRSTLTASRLGLVPGHLPRRASEKRTGRAARRVEQALSRPGGMSDARIGRVPVEMHVRRGPSPGQRPPGAE